MDPLIIMDNSLVSCVALNTANPCATHYSHGCKLIEACFYKQRGHYKRKLLQVSEVKMFYMFHDASLFTGLIILKTCPSNVATYLVTDNMGTGKLCMYVCGRMGVCVLVCVHVCPVPLVRVWLKHETEFVCGMPARHSCCMQIRKEW